MGSYCWSGLSREKKKSLVPVGIQNPDHPAHSLVTIRIMLSQLRVHIILMSESKIKSLKHPDIKAVGTTTKKNPQPQKKSKINTGT